MAVKKQLVLIFGAGATRGAYEHLPPPPLDKDFFEIAGQLKGRGTRRLAVRVLKDVFALYGRVNGIGLERYFQDIETRAEIGRFAKPQNQPKDWARRQTDLEELIRRALLHTTCDLDQRPPSVHVSTAHSDILRQLVRQDTLITFNYDTVIEESFPLERGNWWNPVDGYGTKAGGITREWARHWKARHKGETTTRSSVHLLKLHGSLNWTLYKTRKVRLKSRPYTVQARQGTAPRFENISILPPGWHKRISVNPYKKLWREARLRLERSSALAIVGYSLPETDLLAKALFSEVCRLRAARKDYVKHLYLADPSEAVKDRFVEMFIPALGPNGQVYRFNGIRDLQKVWNRDGVQR